MGEKTRGVFNHHVVMAIIQDVIWSPRTKLWKVLLPETQDFDCLITFTVTMIRWALDYVRGGHPKNFYAVVYGLHYRDALHRMETIRKGNYGTELQCLNHLTQCILQRRKEIVDHCTM